MNTLLKICIICTDKCVAKISFVTVNPNVLRYLIKNTAVVLFLYSRGNFRSETQFIFFVSSSYCLFFSSSIATYCFTFIKIFLLCRNTFFYLLFQIPIVFYE